MKFGIGDYKTRDGREAKVCVINSVGLMAKLGYVLAGFVKTRGEWEYLTWTVDGKFSVDGDEGRVTDHARDLIPPQVVRYARVYDNGAPHFGIMTFDIPDRNVPTGRLHRLTFEGDRLVAFEVVES